MPCFTTSQMMFAFIAGLIVMGIAVVGVSVIILANRKAEGKEGKNPEWYMRL